MSRTKGHTIPVDKFVNRNRGKVFELGSNPQVRRTLKKVAKKNERRCLKAELIRLCEEREEMLRIDWQESHHEAEREFERLLEQCYESSYLDMQESY